MRRVVPVVGVLTVLLVSAQPAGAALVPKNGQVVPNGSDVQGECVLQDGQESGREASWQIQGVIPAFLSDLNLPGIEVAPPAEELPRFSKSPTDPFGNDYVEDPALLALPQRAGCDVLSFDPLGAKNLVKPGPYVFEQRVFTAHFRIAPTDGDPPPPQPCAGNDPEYPDPASDIAPPPTSDTWVVDAYCNTVTTIGFYVQGASSCPISADMSKWPKGSPYINQYDAGARLRLPVRESRAGGNACGPSSLLMAMLATAGSGRLPGLREAFDATIRDNKFASGPGVAFSKSLGWKSAHSLSVGKDVQKIETAILTEMSTASGSGPGPIVLSTAFGGATWGETGGGHMIAIVGTDGRGSFIVEDPAGNYFATPQHGYSDTAGGHYGPRSCGHRAIYPHYWVLAYARGRWLLALGARTVPRRGAAPRAAAAPRFGSAISVSDAHPGASDAPRSFWLQDAQGRRAGIIDGEVVEEIPDSSVGQDQGGWSDPAIGDPGITQDGTAATAVPRSIVVPGPGAGLTLHVAADGPFALSSDAWVDGALIASDAVKAEGALPAVRAIASYTRLAVGKARVRRHVVAVPLTCAGPSRCRFAMTLTAKKGVLARRTATVRGRLTVRLPVRRRNLTATLVVSQLRTGVAPVEVSRQAVRL